MSNLENSQLVEVIAQLRSLNFSHDVLLDAVDDNNKLVARNILINTEVEGQRVDNGGQLLAVVSSMRRMVSDISRSSKELLEFFTSNDMQEEENRRELLDALRGRREGPPPPRNSRRDTGGGMPTGLGSILTFAAALIGGTVVGFVTETAKMFSTLIKNTKIYENISLAITKTVNILKSFGQYISSIANAAFKFLDNTKIGKAIVKGFDSIRLGLTSFVNSVKLIGENTIKLVRESSIVKSVTNTISQIAESWRKFTGALRSVGSMIRPLFGAADEGLTIGGRLARTFPNIAKFFTSIGNIFGVFTRGFKTGLSIGKGIANAIPKLLGVLKALARPFVFIVAAFESIMGAIKGYKEGGVLGAVKGAISGFLIGLVGGVVDLVKDIVSWVANKLGFENFSKLLDGFSFSQLLKDGVDAIFDTAIYAFDWFKSIFSFEKFSKAFENFGLAGIWSTLAGGILDTLKGAVSWIATMFGAFDLAVALDNFSFTDTINKALAFVFDEIGKAMDGLIDWLMNIPTLITDSIYEYAGLKGKATSNTMPASESLTDDQKSLKAKEAGYQSWDDYKSSGWKYKTPAAGSLTDDQKSLKAKEAGYQSWDDYKSSGWKYKTPMIAPISNTTGAELLNSTTNVMSTPVVVNNYGGNVSNNTTSAVSNNSTSYDPIITGSSLGFAVI